MSRRQYYGLQPSAYFSKISFSRHFKSFWKYVQRLIYITAHAI